MSSWHPVAEEMERPLAAEDYLVALAPLARLRMQVVLAAYLFLLVVSGPSPLALAGLLALIAATALQEGRVHGRILAKSRANVRVDDPFPPGTYRVHVRYTRERHYLGADEGLVSFVNGWMLFDGIRSTFSVGAEAIWDMRFTHADPLMRGCEFVIALQDGPKVVEVGLSLEGDSQLNEFSGALRRFQREGLVPSGAAVLPPREAHPSVGHAQYHHLRMARKLAWWVTSMDLAVVAASLIAIAFGIGEGAAFALLAGVQTYWVWSLANRAREVVHGELATSPST
jgi:hypothetical protein